MYNYVEFVVWPDKPFAMAPGVYTYKFQCDLPKELPTSCEEKFGFIRYLASVHIVLQPLSADKVHSVAFTVIKPYNLNAEPIFQVSSDADGDASTRASTATKKKHYKCYFFFRLRFVLAERKQQERKACKFLLRWKFFVQFASVLFP